jgi:hypothetical protein
MILRSNRVSMKGIDSYLRGLSSFLWELMEVVGGKAWRKLVEVLSFASTRS